MTAASHIEFAPAKINLALHVTGRRPDGYHLIESLVTFTRFGDRVEAVAAAEDSFAVTGRYAAEIPLDDSNLVLRARDALRARLGREAAPAVAISLDKNLPVASGVGGGSADAAATLRALSRVWNAGLDEAALLDVAAPLGADLPMCVASRPLVARGTGQELSLVAGAPALAFVLVNPGVAVATPAVFGALARRDNEPMPPPPDHLDFHGLRNWLDTTRNDLEAAALAIEPAIGRAKAALERADAGFVRMSGSGATCFGLFETGNVAKRAAAKIRTKHPGWFVAATRSVPSEGEAHGQE